MFKASTVKACFCHLQPRLTKKLRPSKKSSFFGDFKAAVRLLRNKLPTTFPFRVTRSRLKSHAGDCGLSDGRKKRFHIRVSSLISNDAAIMVLLHEYAHMLSWHAPDWLPGDHGIAWGIAYSKVYCTWMGLES